MQAQAQALEQRYLEASGLQSAAEEEAAALQWQLVGDSAMPACPPARLLSSKRRHAADAINHG